MLLLIVTIIPSPTLNATNLRKVKFSTFSIRSVIIHTLKDHLKTTETITKQAPWNVSWYINVVQIITTIKIHYFTVCKILHEYKHFRHKYLDRSPVVYVSIYMHFASSAYQFEHCRMDGSTTPLELYAQNNALIIIIYVILPVIAIFAVRLSDLAVTPRTAYAHVILNRMPKILRKLESTWSSYYRNSNDRVSYPSIQWSTLTWKGMRGGLTCM